MICSQTMTTRKKNKQIDPKVIFDKALKPPKSFFDWCYSQIPTYEWKNKERVIKASNRENCLVISKKLTKRTSFNFYGGQYNFCIVMVTKKRIEYQTYCFWNEVEQGIQKITWNFVNIEQFSNDKHTKVTKTSRGYSFGLTPMYSFMGGAYERVEIYDNNYIEKIKTVSELKYVKMKNYDRHSMKTIYKYRKEIEFLQNIHANKFANQIMNPSICTTGTGYIKSVDMRTISKKWLQNNKAFFKNSDKTFFDYQLNDRLKQRNSKPVLGIEKYLTYKDIDKIPKGIGLIKFQNWVIKNKVKFRLYLDYLNVLHDLGIEPTGNTNLIIPKDLTKAHDNSVELLNQKKNKANNKMYKKRLKQIKFLEKQIGDYIFKVPHDLNEIIQEGKNLHHCVGNSYYINDHKKGKTTIVFVRKKETPNESLYTIEYKNKQIIQMQGKHSRENIPKEVKDISQQWLDLISKKNR